MRSKRRADVMFFALAIVASVTAVSLSAASYFGWLPGAQEQVALSPLEAKAPEAKNLSEVDAYVSDLVSPEKAETEVVSGLPVFDRDAVLDDVDARISDEFAVSPSLRDRVGFWFDVYTKYDDNRRIIHYARYPWIIFKVVDVTDIIHASEPRRRWMRNMKADKVVSQETDKIRAALQTIAKRKTMNDLNATEEIVVQALSKLEGDVRKLARQALGDVRVQTGQRNFFVEGLEISPRYLGTMEKIFKAKKLPIELTRIPFVESSFKQHATSKVGASGIWQFMGNTGRKFMMVSDSIDERRSPFKASEGAARLLKENHMILYRSWPLAITAWNHGPGGIRKASKAAGSRDLGIIVSKYRSKSFDFASSNFYSEFLAALHAERYHERIFGPLLRQPELEIQAVRLPRSVRIGDIIRVSGLTRDEFLSLNPELTAAAKRNSFLPAGFRLHVPSAIGDMERALASRDDRRTRKSS